MINEEGKNLVFICGLPRSGTTLLTAILGNHPRVFAPPEPWLLLRLAEVYGDPAENKIFDDYVAGRAVKSFLSRTEFTACARAFARQAYNAILEKQHADILMDKTPRYYHILPFIRELFPEAKMIWLKRNPLDVAASIKTHWKRGVDILTGRTLDPVSFDTWFGLEKLVEFFDRPSPNHLEISYEALVSEPAAEIEGLARFCGIDYSAALLDLGRESRGKRILEQSDLGDSKIQSTHAIHSDSVGLWKKAFSPGEAQALAGLIGRETFVRMGYATLIESAPHLFPSRPDAADRRKIREQIANDSGLIRLTQLGRIYDLEFQINSLTQQLNEQRARLADLQRENQSLQETRADASALREKAAALEREKREVETASEAWRGRLLAEQADKQNALSALQARLQTAESLSSEKADALAHLQQRHQDLAEEKSRAESRLQQELATQRRIDLERRAEFDRLAERYQKIRWSASYRCGLLLLYPLRKARKLIGRIFLPGSR